MSAADTWNQSPLTRFSAAVAWFAALGCVLAVFPWPYGYFVFLRWLVTAASVLLIVQEAKSPQFRPGVGILGLVLAILFNPFAPVPFARETWIALDISAAIALVLSSPVGIRRSRNPLASPRPRDQHAEHQSPSPPEIGDAQVNTRVSAICEEAKARLKARQKEREDQERLWTQGKLP